MATDPRKRIDKVRIETGRLTLNTMAVARPIINCSIRGVTICCARNVSAIGVTHLNNKSYSLLYISKPIHNLLYLSLQD